MTSTSNTLGTPSMDETIVTRGSGVRPDPMAGPQRGSTLGRYVVLRRLGAGGMGAVYEAFDPELERKVALKVMHRGAARTDSSLGRTRLLREAQAMAKLSHPNVITIYDVGTVEGQVFIAMELLDGQPLGEWAAEDRSPRRILPVVCAAGAGLVAAHAAGLVHRDFKPDNVLVTRDGRVIVLDFGLATARGEGSDLDSNISGESSATQEIEDELVSASMNSALSAELTRTGAMVGSPAYMAPEQHRGQTFDARCDQFAFCVAVWESLCGERPFTGENVAALVHNVLGGRSREPPAGVRLPRFVHRALSRGLSTVPEDRWPDMSALLVALDRDPARGRRRWGLGLAIVGLGAALLTGNHLRESARVRECERTAETESTMWRGDARERVRGGFLALGIPHAEESFDRLAEVMDPHVEAWTQQRQIACEESREYPERSRVRLNCLEHAKGRVDALVAVLGEPDAKLPGRARYVAAQILLRLDGCDDPDEIRARLPTPADPDQAEEVGGIRRDVTLAFVLRGAGRYEDALAVAQQATERAEALGYSPLVAEAQQQWGEALGRLGRREQSLGHFITAIARAHEGGHAEAEAEAWVSFLYCLGVALGETDHAMKLVPVAEAAVAVANTDGLRAALASNVGTLHLQRGELEQAKAHYLRGIEVIQQTRNEEHPSLVTSLSNLAIVLSELGDHDEAKRTFDRVLELRTRVYGADHIKVADSLHNVALETWHAGDSEGSIRLNMRALKIRQARLPAGHLDIADTHEAICAVLQMTERASEAEPHCIRVLDIRRPVLDRDHPLIARAENNMGLVYAHLERYSEALPHHDRAIAIWRGRGEIAEDDLASALAHKAKSLRLSHREQEARKAQREVVELLEALGKTSTERFHDELMELAHIEASLGEHEAAIEMFERIIGHQSATPEYVGEALLSAAESLRTLGRSAEAKAMFERVVKLHGARKRDVARARERLGRR